MICCTASSLGLPFDPFLRGLLTTVVLNFNGVEVRNLLLYRLWVLSVIEENRPYPEVMEMLYIISSSFIVFLTVCLQSTWN